MLAKYTIQAPFDGYVVAEFTEVGAWLKQGDPVAEVIQLDWVELEAFVTERHIVGTRVGLEARIVFESLPGQEFTGHVHRVISQADVRRETSR